jgi:hypothetical protein
MDAPMMTPTIPTKVPPFGKRSPTAAFGFDVFDAVEEPEVLLAEVPLVAVALDTCGDKEQCQRRRQGFGNGKLDTYG